jgi:hypothetical protein
MTKLYVGGVVDRVRMKALRVARFHIAMRNASSVTISLKCDPVSHCMQPEAALRFLQPYFEMHKDCCDRYL